MSASDRGECSCDSYDRAMPSPLKPIAIAFAGAAAVAGVRKLFSPTGEMQSTLVDWDGVRRVAYNRTRERRGKVDPALSAQYEEVLASLKQPMAEVLEGEPQFQAVNVISRKQFIDRNVEMSARLLAPLETLRTQLPESQASKLGRKATTKYVGELFGYLSRRVLGQFDPVLRMQGDEQLPDDASPYLMIVDRNLVHFSREHGAPIDSLRRVVAMHEATHVWQFAEHPWIAQRLNETISEVVLTPLNQRLAPEDKDKRRIDFRSAMHDAKAQLEAVRRIQAVMTLLEGHANFVMNTAGRAAIPEFDGVHEAFDRRKQARPIWEQIIQLLTGMRFKLQQYEVGESFCDAVVKDASLSTLNLVWAGPENLPTMEEYRKPSLWLDRIKK